MTLICASFDCDAATRHTVEAFAVALARAGEPQAPFEKFGELAFQFGVAHPAMPAPEKTRGSYWAQGDTFFASGDLDYQAWVGDSWARRVGAVAEASHRALATVFKTRMTPEERTTLARLIDTVAGTLAAAPPDQLPALEPIHVSEDGSGGGPSVSFRPPEEGERLRALPPSEVRAYFKAQAAEQRPEMVKLYRRQDGALLYREAWPEDQEVVEHAGVCGEGGTVLRHPAQGPLRQREVIAAIAAKARAEGFRAVPEARLATLLVSKAISGRGTEEDLRRRHALEDFLDRLTGWLGLGHCDGGSTGSGSMEAACLVVDHEIAARALARELAASSFSDFAVEPRGR